MNKDILMVALGVGIGAAIFTPQGRKFLNSLPKLPVVKAVETKATELLKALPPAKGFINEKS